MEKFGNIDPKHTPPSQGEATAGEQQKAANARTFIDKVHHADESRRDAPRTCKRCGKSNQSCD